jgi:hypothetical protein
LIRVRLLAHRTDFGAALKPPPGNVTLHLQKASHKKAQKAQKMISFSLLPYLCFLCLFVAIFLVAISIRPGA